MPRAQVAATAVETTTKVNPANLFIASHMDVLGIDFTSAPKRAKPLIRLRCIFDGQVLRAGDLEEWSTFSAFEEALQRPGPWIAGIDFPFGQSRRFI